MIQEGLSLPKGMDGTGSDSDEKWVSVITCDMEGRIKTFNDGAEKIFGYSKEEIIGKKRVSMFSPGTIVLGHVGNWLSEASQNGEYRGKTAFVRKDRSKFAANIKITPTYKTIDGKKIQIGYCGRTEPLLDEDPEAAIPPTSFTTKLITGLVILRLPFVTAALIPAILALVWAHWNGMVDNGVWGLGVMGILFAAAFLHLSANVFNDYFDVKNGVDDANNDYFLQYSGGSRAVELGLITLRGQAILASTLLTLAGAIGLWLMLGADRPGVLWYGLAGALGGFFYTAPPLRLSTRHGMGEMTIGLLFGPLMTMGTVYAYTGVHSWSALALGIPLGLITTCILYINEFPDTPSDLATGKIHLVAMLGVERARYGYAILMILAYASIVGLGAASILPMYALICLACAPWAYHLAQRLINEYNQRSLISANEQTIYMHMVVGILLIAGVAIA